MNKNLSKIPTIWKKFKFQLKATSEEFSSALSPLTAILGDRWSTLIVKKSDDNTNYQKIDCLFFIVRNSNNMKKVKFQLTKQFFSKLSPITAILCDLIVKKSDDNTN